VAYLLQDFDHRSGVRLDAIYFVALVVVAVNPIFFSPVVGDLLFPDLLQFCNRTLILWGKVWGSFLRLSQNSLIFSPGSIPRSPCSNELSVSSVDSNPVEGFSYDLSGMTGSGFVASFRIEDLDLRFFIFVLTPISVKGYDQKERNPQYGAGEAKDDQSDEK
jgi:hypothetical protein